MDYILIISFFLIAIIYASVGFGGGTSYLALMGVMMIGFEIMRPAALLCNIVVVTNGAYVFYKEGLLDIKKIWPFLVSSVPLAFVGGQWPIREDAFFQLLGWALVAAAISLWAQDYFSANHNNEQRHQPPVIPFVLGSSIGLLSGLVSIGGGIFLSPILHFMKWDSARRISALASVFILVNSLSGLAGQFTRSASFDWKFIFPLLIAVWVGGQIGSRLGAKKLNPIYIRRITAILILVAGVNILINH
ncbi:MAG: sulfite exporter TauE/SafE family protein [Cyclobacteriaceae bacterium]|nr:sulfite exporter TauE/SafE family protein [Cyclobacteriaceae bacterium]